VTAVVMSHTGSGADAHGQLAGFHAGLQASPWAFPHELLVPRRRRRLFGEVDIALPATLRR
jgi:hypothetical protein